MPDRVTPQGIRGRKQDHISLACCINSRTAGAESFCSHSNHTQQCMRNCNGNLS